MKSYFRIMLGSKSKYAQECFSGNFIGVDYRINQDLTGRFHETWRDFNKEFIPIYLKGRPEKTKIAAGLACGIIWTVSYYLKKEDIVLCPNGFGSYMVGEITGDYYYKHGDILPHRRPVRWYPNLIDRAVMSEELKKSTGSILASCDITKYGEEIESLIGGHKPPVLISTDSSIEDQSTFALEKHLEDFLVQNWKQTELGKDYDIYEEEGEVVGQQYPSDTGPIDILAISKDKITLLIVELKRGRASDNVVGQIQRYMGYVKDELAESNQKVKGVIIALEDDIKIKRALSVAENIEFYKYQVNFKLFKS